MKTDTERTDDAVRRRSGEVSSGDPLVSFLYTLLRDHLPAGTVERLATEAREISVGHVAFFTNGWLAAYAEDLAASLRAPFRVEMAPARDEAAAVDEADTLACPVCYGTGKVQVTFLRPCANCGGTGRIPVVAP